MYVAEVIQYPEVIEKGLEKILVDEVRPLLKAISALLILISVNHAIYGIFNGY